MPISDARRILITAALLVSACSHPVPGVLTLAPAGMRIGGTATPHPDGSLTMAADCSAQAEAYVDAGTVTITVTAAAATADQPMSIELWFAGTSLGSQRVPSPQRTALSFHAHARASGPVNLRLVAHASSQDVATAAAMVDVEKVVITEP